MTGAAAGAAARVLASKVPPEYADKAAKFAKGAAALAAENYNNNTFQKLGITKGQIDKAAELANTFAYKIEKNKPPPTEATGAKNPKPPGGNQAGGYKSNNIFRYYDKFNQPNIYKFN